MADSRELRAIVGAMTERPWAHSAPHGFIVNEQHELGTAETYQYENSGNNADAIVALANHADALLELVSVVEGVTAWPSHYHLPESFIARLREALTKVHAVGKEGKDA